MEIHCYTITELAAVCAELVRQGVTFNADSHALVIHCTGGY